MSGGMYRNCMIRSVSVFSILLFINASISIPSAAQSLEGQRIIQQQDLTRLKQKFQKAARKCCGLPDGTVDTTSNEYQRLLRRYNDTTSSTKLLHSAEDTRAGQWETEAQRFGLTKTGSNPKDIRADGDFVGDTHDVSRYRDHLREMGHDVVDYGYKMVDTTTDATVWRNEEQIDLNAREADPDVLQDMYEETGLDPRTHSPQDVIKEAKFIDDDAFSTTGGRASTGVKGEPSDALGKVLDNEMKFRHALETADMKTMGKSVDKMAFPELKNADPEFYSQAEILRNYGDPVKAGIVDLGDSEAVAKQKIENWQTKAEAHIKENLAIARQHSQTTRMTRERIAERVEATDPEMAERIRARNDRVVETNTRVENMNRASQDRMVREGKGPRSTEVNRYRNELQAKVRENVKGANLVKENGTGRKIETKMGEGTEGTNVRQTGEELGPGATANRILQGIGLIMVAHDAAGRIERAYKAADEYKPQVAIEEGVSFTSGMAGAAALGGEWGWAGGLIGSAICPGIGTTIGGFAGGLVGGIIGYTKGDSWGRRQAQWISSKLGVNQNVGNKEISSSADKLYNSLLRKGVPKDKVMEATKLLLSGHLEQFKKHMAALRAKYVSSLADVMGKEKMSGSERVNFINCMCRNKGGGMLGNHMDPDDGCVTCGPLNCWPVPVGTAKTTVLGCVNQLARARYRGDKAVFEEMHSLDEKTYRKKRKLIEEENAGRVAKKRQTLERLRKDKKTLVEAGKLFLQIKDWLKTDDKNRLEMGLSSNLWSLAYANTYTGKMDSAVSSLEWSRKVQGRTTENDEEFEQFARWQRNWKQALSKTFPKIRQQISFGDLVSAQKLIYQLGVDMLNGNRLPEAERSPEYLDIRDQFRKKKEEYNVTLNQVIMKIGELEKARDPRSAIPLLKKFLNGWQHEITRKNILSKRLAHDESLVRMADESARAGDVYTANGNYSNAVKSYQDSLYKQRDSSVQSKLDSALSEIADARKSLAQEKLEQKVQKLLGEGTKNWQEGKLQQAIAKVAQAQKLAGEDRDIAKRFTTMTKQKRELDTKLDQVADLLEKGKIESGEIVLTEAAVISTNYPRYKELLQRLNGVIKGEQQTQGQAGQLPAQPASKRNLSDTLSKPANQSASENNQAKGAINGDEISQTGITSVGKGSPRDLGEPSTVGKGTIRASGGSVNAGDSRASLTINKKVYEPKERIRLNFTSPPEQNAWIGMYDSKVKHTYDAPNLTYQNCDAKASGERVFGAPNSEGEYQFRLFGRKDRNELVILAFTVKVDKGAASLTINKRIYEPNEKIQLNFKATTLQNVWIGMYDSKIKHTYDAPNMTYQNSDAQANGERVFDAPNKEGSYEFRLYERTNQKELVILPFIVKVDKDAANLTIDKAVYEPNEKIKLNFKATALQNVWIGMYDSNVKHTYEESNITYQNSDAEVSGKRVFGAPNKEGAYEFRLYERTNHKELAVLPFTVKVKKEAATLKLEKNVYEPNEEIKLHFTATPLQNAWIGMYNSETEHTYHAANLTYQNSDAQAGGDKEFGAPRKEGRYEFRLYERTNQKELVIVPFTVKVDKDAASLTIDKKVYEPKEKIKLDFTSTPLQNAWIGMYTSGAEHAYSTPNITWKNCDAKAAGKRVFGAPNKEGLYEFRLYERTNQKELAVLPFTVKVKKEAAALTIPKSSYEKGEKIRLRFTATPLQNAWIGMYESATEHTYHARNITYQNCDEKASGVREFTAPKKGGSYQFRLYERTNEKELVVLPFSVKAN